MHKTLDRHWHQAVASATLLIHLFVGVSAVAPRGASAQEPSPTASPSPTPSVAPRPAREDPFKDAPPEVTGGSRAKRTEQELGRIPKAPSAPKPPEKPVFADVFTCERFFIYQGRKYVCDSYVRQDAERLRPIISDVPEAVAELDLYQENRRKIRYAAYTGTFGLVLALASGIFIKNDSARLGATMSGLAISGGGFLYSFAVLRTNEQHLGNAVQKFNEARPETPIELQFSTSVSF